MADERSGRHDIAMSKALEIARHVERIRPERSQVVQRVVAVAGAFTVEDAANFPTRGGRPQELDLREGRRAGVQVVTGYIVLREAIAARVAEADSDRQFVRNERAGDGSPYVAPIEVSVGTRHGAGPVFERWSRARDVDQAA